MSDWLFRTLYRSRMNTFAGIPGNTCRVQSATTLTPPADWTDFSTNTVPPLGLFQVTNFVGGSTTRFYRTVSP